VCIYNNPFTTNFRFSAELIARLAQLPSLKAVKMPLPLESQVHEELSLLRAAISDDSFAIGYSGDWGAADALLSGADAWFSVIGGIYPRIALALTRHAQGGDGSKSAKLNSQLEPLWKLFREFGGLRVVHSLITRQRLPDAHLPRPLLPIPAAARERLDQIAPRMERLEAKLKGN
jgi:4-hydroxy-tetrahydrodipicolinate synthase